ncbi:MAG TPA: glycosyltransferase family 9 protein [Candidatus Tyrphobacter sp.]
MRILLARTDRIGDLILSTPAISTVRASFPGAHIAMVTSAYNHVVMERNDDVDELLVLGDVGDAARLGGTLRDYDLAVALAPRIVDLRLVGATHAKHRIGYTYARRWVSRLTARLYVDELMISEADPRLSERDPGRQVRHEVEQLLDLVAMAGARRRITRLRLDVRDGDRAAVRDVPENPIVFHLGLRWFDEGSTAESTQALLRELGDLGQPVVVTCPDECLAFAAALEPPHGGAILSGLAFFEWAAVFERAACIVTVDTAATHVASAVRRPTLVVFEHRYFELNSQEWAPYGVPNVLVRKPASEDSASLARLRRAIVEGASRLMHA